MRHRAGMPENAVNNLMWFKNFFVLSLITNSSVQIIQLSSSGFFMVLILYYILLVTLPKIITPDFFLKTTSTTQLNLHETRKNVDVQLYGYIST